VEPAVIVPLLAQALDPNDAVSEAHLTEWAEHLAVTAQQPPEPHGWRWRWQRVSLPDGEGEALAIAQPDRPLLFATALIAFDRAGIRPRFAFHPVVTAADGQPESWMLFICEPLPKAARATLEAALTEGFLQAVAASDDWPLMRERANVTASLLPRWCGTQSDPTWVRECQALLEWVASGHFVLLGCRDYQVERNSDSVQLRRIPDSGLGVLRDSSARSEYSESFARLPAPARELLLHYPEPMLITQGSQRAIVHRYAYPSEILVWERDASGTAVRERRFLGLWTATAYRYPVAQLPLLRHKAAAVQQAVGAQNTDAEVIFTDSATARVWFRFWLPQPTLDLTWNEAQLERTVAAIALPWRERLWQALHNAAPKRLSERAWTRFHDGFDAVAQRRWRPEVIAPDLLALAQLPDDCNLWLTLEPDPAPSETEPRWQLRLWHRFAPALLADLSPLLESLGARLLEENADEIRTDAGSWWLHDLRLTIAWGDPPKPEDIERFIAAFHALWARQADCDGYNRLVTLAGLTWREALLWRAYAAWLKQSALPFTPNYILEMVLRHPAFVRAWTQAFHARFDPKRTHDHAAAYQEWRERLAALIEQLPTLDEERIARAFLATLDATVRTNFYREDEAGTPRPWLALKIASQTIDFLPDPKPWRETFVFAPNVEGVHLRGGPVARGGLRWSDRKDDYRTEILGLMKAQLLTSSPP